MKRVVNYTASCWSVYVGRTRKHQHPWRMQNVGITQVLVLKGGNSPATCDASPSSTVIGSWSRDWKSSTCTIHYVHSLCCRCANQHLHRLIRIAYVTNCVDQSLRSALYAALYVVTDVKRGNLETVWSCSFGTSIDYNATVRVWCNV